MPMMASVLNLSQRQPTAHTGHVFSGMEPLSLSLDLSLGGLFSKHDGNFQSLSAQRSLTTSPNSHSFPAEERKAWVTPSMMPIKSQWDVPAGSFKGTPLPAVAANERTDHFETKSLQAQRRHEARKRRKSIIEGKLQKRAKEDSQEELTRLSNAHYLGLLTPPCDESKEKAFIEEAGRPGRMCENSVLTSEHPESISSLWVKIESASDQPGHAGIEVSGNVELNDVSRPVAMVDFMNLLSCEKNAKMECMGSDLPSEGRHDAGFYGDESSVSQPSAYSLHVSSEHWLKRHISLDVKHGSNGIGDVVCSVQGPSSLLSTSSGFSQLTSCGPYNRQQMDQPHATSYYADHSEITIPTCGSSSQLLSWNRGGKSDTKYSHINGGGGDSSECIDKSCNSSSSEIENECVRDEQGNDNDAISIQKSRHIKEEYAEPAQPTVTMPAIYPHPFAVMPYAYPYGVPLPWSFSLPWYMQGSSHKTFSLPISSASVEQSTDASMNPFGGYPNPYCLPVSGSPWLPVVPPGVETCTKNSNPGMPSVQLKKNLHPGHNGQKIPDLGQGVQGEVDLVPVLDVQAELTADEDGEDNIVAAEARGEIVKALRDSSLDEPLKKKSKERGFLMRDGKPSGDIQPGKQSQKVHTSFEKHVAVERQQSLPLSNERISKKKAYPLQQSLSLANERISKKKKVVRFNSIDGAGASVCNEVGCSIDGNESIRPQQFVNAVDCSMQTGYVPSKIDLPGNIEVDPKGRTCGDGSQNINLAEGDVRINSNVGPLMHSDDTNINDGGMDCENDVGMHCESVEGDSSATSNKPLSKSTNKDSPVGRKSVKSFLRVTTHGLGPHGKTIHGVMYMTEEKQARLICVCHGKLMSPLEFVQHSGSSNLANPERSIVLEPFSYVDHGVSVPA